MKTTLDYAPAAELIAAANTIFFLSHEYTDGDDLGSMLALGSVLKARGKKVEYIARGGLSKNLLFLPDAQLLRDHIPPEDFDLAIFLGCGVIDRIGFDPSRFAAHPILNIDHHVDNHMFGTVNLVESTAAANCEIIYYFIKFLGASITKTVAVNLLTGIFNDTGGFRHANTNAQVLEIAAELMRKGARIDRIADYYFGKSELSKLRAWALALENARFDEGRQMVYSIVTEDELASIGAKPEDLEGIASVLTTIPEARYSMVLKQRGEEIKGSLRSEAHKGVDVAAIARSFGGGGHVLAAGFKLKGKIEKTKEGWKIT